MPAAEPVAPAPSTAKAAQPAAVTPAAAAPAALPNVEAPFGAVRLSGDLAALHAGAKVSFVLHGQNLDGLLSRYAPAHPEGRKTAAGIALGQGALPEAILPRHRASSFLVDFDQSPIAELGRGLDAKPDLVALRTRVARSFSDITYGTFWTASRAATLHAGDCSEHAVVVAALARAHGMPARVVLGYALFSDGEHGLAIGHAWTEVHDGTRWQRVDATPFGAEQGAYLIQGELQDEGPRFSLALLGSLGADEIESIEIVRDAQ